MSTLKDRLETDLRTAMKARDELSTGTLRMALAAVRNAEVAGERARDLDDDEVRAVLTKEAKKRRDAATAFADAGRAERADRERAEEEVLVGYLPAQLSDEELDAMIDAAIAEAGASTMKDMGAVMGRLMPKLKGRAEGAVVSARVKGRLG